MVVAWEPAFGEPPEPEEIGELRATLSKLPPPVCLAFGASCCERLLPCYNLCEYNEGPLEYNEGRGNFSTLRQHLDKVWELLGQGVFTSGPERCDRSVVCSMLEDMKERFPGQYPRVPRPEGCYDWVYAGTLGKQAEYALGAVLALLHGAVEGREADYCAVAGDAALQAVRDFVAKMNDPWPFYGPEPDDESDDELDMFLELVETLPLMVQEREKQERDLLYLAARPRLDPKFIEGFRRDAAHGGIQPFLRGLHRARTLGEGFDPPDETASQRLEKPPQNAED
jgi:hypothetical protein